MYIIIIFHLIHFFFQFIIFLEKIITFLDANITINYDILSKLDNFS